MPTAQGGEGPQGHEQGQSPYNLAGRQVGELALMLHACMESPNSDMPFRPGDTPQWAQEDRDAMINLLWLERSLPMLKREVGGEVEQHFPSVSRFHATIPFTKDERQWLVTEDSQLWEWEPTQKEAEAHKLDYPVVDRQIIRVAPRHNMDGDDLVRRWAAWRRRVQEFTDQNGLDEAQQALNDLGRELFPYGPPPGLQTR